MTSWPVPTERIPASSKHRPGSTDERLLSFLKDGAPADGDALSGSDWDDLLRTASLHGVTPLLYRRLAGSADALPIPAEPFRSLHTGYLQNAARNIRLYHQLGAVLGRLRREGIRVIPLKGAHLAEAVYGNIALRPMGDLDLLVRETDLWPVEEILLGMGYLPAECNRRVARDNCHFVYTPSDRGTAVVEVHWSLVAPGFGFAIDADGLWKRSRPAVLAGVEVSILSPEDLLLHLCLHTSKHLFEGTGLKSLCDISEVIRHYGEAMDWEKVRSRSGEWGIDKCVYAALTLAGEILGLSLPKDLMETVQPVEPGEKFMAMARSRILACGHPASNGSGLSSNVARLFGPLRMTRKLSLLLRRIFPSGEEMSRWYPAAPGTVGILFRYPERFRDLLGKYGRHSWRLLRRDPALRMAAERENEFTRWREWLIAPGPRWNSRTLPRHSPSFGFHPAGKSDKIEPLPPTPPK